MVLPEIIGLYSPLPRSGKGTAAEVLVDRFGYHEMRFAQPIRDMWAAFLGITNPHNLYLHETLEGALKERPVSPCGVSYRDFGVELGDGLRQRFGVDFWVKHLAQRYEDLEDEGQLHVVISDVRYPNEHAWIKSMGGQVWRLARTDGGGGQQTVSEGLLEKHPFDVRITAPCTDTVRRAVWEALNGR